MYEGIDADVVSIDPLLMVPVSFLTTVATVAVEALGNVGDVENWRMYSTPIGNWETTEVNVNGVGPETVCPAVGERRVARFRAVATPFADVRGDMK
jgi:hypothetical protein